MGLLGHHVHGAGHDAQGIQRELLAVLALVDFFEHMFEIVIVVVFDFLVAVAGADVGLLEEAELEKCFQGLYVWARVLATKSCVTPPPCSGRR